MQEAEFLQPRTYTVDHFATNKCEKTCRRSEGKKKRNKRNLLTLPMVWNKEALKEAAMRIGMGKLVAPGTTLEKRVPGPTLETP